MSVYSLVLALHNVVRWIVLVMLILSVGCAYQGWFGKRAWTASDRKVGMFAGMAVDIQLLLGLLLYFFFSPLTRTAFQDFGAAMRVADLRFFALEHGFYMLLAVVFVHLGSVLPRRVLKKGEQSAEVAVQAHRLAALWFTLTLLIVLIGIPWMRPLLPGLG